MPVAAICNPLCEVYIPVINTTLTLNCTYSNTTDEIFLYEYAVITLEALSQRLHLSPRQTQRFLKKSYGKTFVELRAERRRYNAQLLIAAGACPENAAEQVGYKDVRSLTR